LEYRKRWMTVASRSRATCVAKHIVNKPSACCYCAMTLVAGV